MIERLGHTAKALVQANNSFLQLAGVLLIPCDLFVEFLDVLLDLLLDLGLEDFVLLCHGFDRLLESD